MRRLVGVLKTALVPGSSAYPVLRSAAPAFLQAVYSCPELWSTHSDPTDIPLRNILISDRIELASFALADCTFAMAFGLPQQVDYETSGNPLPNLFLPHEWAQNSPAEFQLLLTDINTCRDNGPGALDWREIEHRLVTWQPPIVNRTKTGNRGWKLRGWRSRRAGDLRFWRICTWLYAARLPTIREYSDV
ncbi:hypothetical protein B0J17DRAFT_411375 [Rhizoctonia solani]|nr:hypothetical protein B0J17DRAFT_411375 [Rhizoctonia solani]